MNTGAFQPLGFGLGLPFKRLPDDVSVEQECAPEQDVATAPTAIEEAPAGAVEPESTEATPPIESKLEHAAMPKHATPESVLALIVANGGEMTSLDLAEKLTGVPQSERKGAIKTLKNSGQITFTGKARGIVYHVAKSRPSERTKPRKGAPGAATARHPGKTPDAIAQAESAEKVLVALQFAADVAQDALDAYLVSIADPAVVGPLRAARDSTKAALTAYSGQGR